MKTITKTVEIFEIESDETVREFDVTDRDAKYITETAYAVKAKIDHKTHAVRLTETVATTVLNF